MKNPLLRRYALFFGLSLLQGMSLIAITAVVLALLVKWI